jgi:glucose-1-phosphate thymidylyltransferase
MKGIILAGGSGSRLYPITKGTSKQLLSIYDKPMIYYPLSVLMLSGIKDILIISNPENLPNFKKLFKNGSDLGLSISYEKQKNPDGIAQAFDIGKDFIKNDDVCLVLGDNIFYGKGFTGLLNSAKINLKNNKATVFGYNVNNPSDFGIASFDTNKNLIKIEEKPKSSKSNTAIVGLYFYPNSVVDVANKIRPSKRGEYEISSVNQKYLENKDLKIELLGRGFTWLDTGTHDSLLEASNFVKTVEKHSGYKVACLEEIAFKMKFINLKKLKELAKPFGDSSYGKYLKSLVNENQ